jgi:Tol biopolymer transport system component
MFSRTGADAEAGSLVHPRRWALAAAAALIASFSVGFAVGDGIMDRRATAPSGGAARLSSGVSTIAPAANDPPANPAEAKPNDDIVGVPETAAVAPDVLPPPPAHRANASPDTPSGSVAHVGEQVSPIEAVSATRTNAFSPAFASDGTSIFFHTGRDRDARSAIEVAAGHSRIMTFVDDGSHNYHPQPSPDGRLVAFDSDRDGERGVYVANRDGSQVRRVSGAGSAAVPTWSRNGEWLTYIRREAGRPAVWNLWMQPVAGGSARRITNHRYGQVWAASWFPDHRRIAYSHEDTLVVTDLQTGGATRYSTPVKGQLVRTPAVSPDGTKIIFQVLRHGAWLLDRADGSMRRVLTDPTAEEFAWSPDGRRVAFHSRRDGRWGLYLLSPSQVGQRSIP